MSEPGTVRVEHPEPGVAILRLYRPAHLNALNTVMFAEIATACETLHADKSVKAVVLTGEGRGFCAGYDLDEAQELAGLSPEEMLERQDLAAASILALRAMRQPVAQDQLLAEATAMARAIAGFSAFGTALTKRALYANLDAPSLHAALEVESRGQAFATRDAGFPEALTAVRAQFAHAAPVTNAPPP